MPLSRSSVAVLARKHPHNAELLRVFVPLVRAQKQCLEDADAVELPQIDTALFSAGKSWMQADEIPYTDGFLKKSITKVANAAIKAMPQQKEAFAGLKQFLRSNPAAARELIALRLRNSLDKADKWAAKHAQPADPAAMLAMLLGGVVAQRFERAARGTDLPSWSKGHCPVCGSSPHGSLLKEKEGRRFLHCSLCGHQWRYSRTACPACDQEAGDKLSLFFLEDTPDERAEACDICKHYLLSLDTRNLSAVELPLELHFMCMAPLDLLMQEKGYSPVGE